MKKLISLAWMGVFCLSLMACGNETSSMTADETAETAGVEKQQEETISAENSQTAENTSTAETDSSGTEGSSVLIVYYSATGNTKTIANYIADATGGDLFELEPVEPYTDEDLNYNDPDSRVSREHDDESLRDVELVSATVDNFANYDEILIGYPVWWGMAAWPVNQFIKNNDFTGKTVIPFCTSASSGLGNSGNLLEEMAGTGDWQEGKRFSSNASDEEIQDWVKSLNLK